MFRLYKISDDSEVILDDLDLDELNELAFLEEVYCSYEIERYAPFSCERTKIMEQGYRFVHDVIKHIELRKGLVNESFGGAKKHLTLIKKIIKKYLQKKDTIQLFFSR